MKEDKRDGVSGSNHFVMKISLRDSWKILSHTACSLWITNKTHEWGNVFPFGEESRAETENKKEISK